MSQHVFSVDEAAQKLGVGRRTVYRLIKTEQLRGIFASTPEQPGRAPILRIAADDLTAFIEQRTKVAS
jgi:predicted DNA-binding transcriptional regulator YafY